MENIEIYILDSNFVTVAEIDTYDSFIWTDRYNACGDFELYTSVESSLLPYAEHGYYVWVKNSEHMMIIEETEITTDTENGNKLKITGRSLESILDRRIVWNQVTLSGKVEDVIRQLINDAIISPSMTERRIPNFIFVDSGDSYIDSCSINETQYLGNNLYEVIVDILTGVPTDSQGQEIPNAKPFDIGFKLIYNFDAGRFEFSLYHGTDRSYNQELNPWVVFSPEFDNIISSDFIETSAGYRNVNLICGETPEEASGKTRKLVYVGNETGLHRREMFTDGSSVQQKYTDENDQEVELTDEQYIAVLRSKALEEITKEENSIVKTFDGEINTSARSFIFGEDFYLGDIVQMYNEYGLGAPARVTEMILSQDTSEIKMYPTFTVV
jgi:hypothetical protein